MTTKLIRTPDWKELRRFRALELKNEGCTHEEVAEALGMSKAAVTCVAWIWIISKSN
jgi:orotate phosphoribosyltransferase-like protein